MVNKALDGPIPGESLTKAPGAGAHERPIQFADMNEALEYLFDRLTDPKQVARMVAIMNAGAPAEAVACTILMSGFMQGKWTVDLALLLGPTVLRMIVAVAVRAGIPENKLKIRNPDKDFEKFVKDFKDYIPGLDVEIGPKEPKQELMAGL